jgi:hypothetical protein
MENRLMFVIDTQLYHETIWEVMVDQQTVS